MYDYYVKCILSLSFSKCFAGYLKSTYYIDTQVFCNPLYIQHNPVSRFAMENPSNPRLKSTKYSDGVFKVSMAVDGK